MMAKLLSVASRLARLNSRYTYRSVTLKTSRLSGARVYCHHTDDIDIPRASNSENIMTGLNLITRTCNFRFRGIVTLRFSFIFSLTVSGHPLYFQMCLDQKEMNGVRY